MLYPVYVHKDKDSAFGLTFPDLPGCFAAADESADIPRAAQEAVEAHYGSDADPIPAPTGLDQWAGSKDFKGGFWMLVDIDLAKVRDKAVRVNVSMSEALLQRIDQYASQRRISRSAFLAAAAEHEMAERAN